VIMDPLRRRLSELPDSVHTVVFALAIAALYFATAAVMEWCGVTARWPLSPPPRVALCAALANLGLSICLLNAIGWVRPLVAAVPFDANDPAFKP